MSNHDNTALDHGASRPGWSTIADRVAAFQRFLRDNDLALTSKNGSPLPDLAYRLEGFFAEID